MIKYAEFCAGIGGFRLGISASPYPSQCVYKNEIDNHCEQTYYANFGEKFDSANIFEVESKKLPNFDILCSGFPCQPFSIAGKQKGFNDNRGTIIIKLLDIIKYKKPNVVFLENVANLEKHNNGDTIKTIIHSLEDLGYDVHKKVIDSSNFGIPQKRPRLYIVAFNISSIGKIDFKFPNGNGKSKVIRDILIKGDYSIPISDKWQDYIDLYTGKKTEYEITFSLPKTRRCLERITPSNCDLNDCIFQIRSSGIRAYSLDGCYPTFAVSNSGGGAMIPVLTKERRHLSVAEIKGIMGFKNSYRFPVSRTDSIKQLANAVCPPVIEAIYDEIARQIV